MGYKRTSENDLTIERWAEELIFRGLLAEFLLMITALVTLFYAFISSLFSVNIVLRHSGTTDPFIYKLTSLWGSHEGSVLLWLFFMLCFAILFYRRKLMMPTRLWGMSFAFLFFVIGLIGSYMILVSNPFLRSVMPSGEGQSLNPVLQDPLFVIHPPLLFLGYAASLFPFCLTLAAFVTGHRSKLYAQEVKYWALKAWSILTIAILLGSYWAYYELGWGGWWFWDPVENVSLLPWLICMALFHAVIAYQKKQVMNGWIQLLSLSLFLLTLLGFFLVRSGLLVSVHSFVFDPVRGAYIAALFLGLCLLSFMCFVKREITSENDASLSQVLSFFSREMMLILSAFFLLIVTMVILLGTFMPLLIEMISGDVISVGAPYYNKIFSLFFPLFALLMLLGIWTSWGQTSFKILKRKFFVTMCLAAFVSLIFFSSIDVPMLMQALVFFSLFSLFIGTVYDARSKMRGKSFFALSGTYKAMLMGHLGFGVMCLSILVASFYGEVSETTLEKNIPKAVGSYQMTYTKMIIDKKDNFKNAKAIIHYEKNHQKFPPMQPERRYYELAQIDLSETALRTTLLYDDLMVLGPIDFAHEKDYVQIRFYHYPLSMWIWIGAMIMAFGGFYALRADKLKQRKEKQK